MSERVPLLPPGFETLEPFVMRWAIVGSANRAQRRSESSEAERNEFYQAAKKLLPTSLELLDRKPLQSLDQCETTLMNLMLSLAHISLAVESQGPDEARHSAARQHMTITRSPAG